MEVGEWFLLAYHVHCDHGPRVIYCRNPTQASSGLNDFNVCILKDCVRFLTPSALLLGLPPYNIDSQALQREGLRSNTRTGIG